MPKKHGSARNTVLDKCKIKEVNYSTDRQQVRTDSYYYYENTANIIQN